MNRLKREYYDSGDSNNLFLHHSSKVIYKKLKKKYKERDIKQFLRTQRNYTLFKQSTGKKNERNAYKVFTVDQLWELDLISLPTLAKFNSGVIHILVCIDVFSRFAFVRPLKNKQPREVVKNLVNIFNVSKRKPAIIQSDAGKEFTGNVMKYFLKNENIEFRVPKTTLPAKCAVVERFNRTLKQRISRYLNWKSVTSQPNEKRYIDAIQTIVDDYNRTIHSTIKIAPQNVTKANSVQLYDRVRTRWLNIPSKISKFLRGDFVRVKRKRDTFEKESKKPLWSNKIYKIVRSIPRHPYPVYEISDLKGRLIDGKLYDRELQKVELPDNTPIELLKSTKNIFDKRVPDNTVRVKTLEGKIRNMDLKREKNAFKNENYYDVISNLK